MSNCKKAFREPITLHQGDPVQRPLFGLRNRQGQVLSPPQVVETAESQGEATLVWGSLPRQTGIPSRAASSLEMSIRDPEDQW